MGKIKEKTLIEFPFVDIDEKISLLYFIQIIVIHTALGVIV